MHTVHPHEISLSAISGPGGLDYLVTSIECDKEVLVSVTPFVVGDHDFTHSSLTPCVALFIEISVLWASGKYALG